MWGIIKIAPGFFIRLFNSDPVLLEKGVPALHIYFFGFVLWHCSLPGRRICSTWKGKKSNIFFDFPKGDHCGAFDNIVAEG